MSWIRFEYIPWHRFCIELILLVLVLIISLVTSLSHLWYRVNVIGREYRFEQEWLVPAISVACRQGFTTPCAPYPENMSLFLKQKVNSMSPDDLPVSWPRWDNSSFVKTHRYLITSIGLLWRYFGIRWDILKVYASVMFAITIVATYFGVRIVFGKLPAFVVAFLTANSPALLFLLPSIRDYSKTMFFTLFLSFLACYLKYFMHHIGGVVLAFVLGTVVGVGIGFRQDMIVLFLLGFLIVMLTSSWKIYIYKRYRYGVILVVYVLPFLLISFPILKAIRDENGAVSSHSLAQGLAYRVEERVLGGKSNYRIVYDSNDMLVHSLVLANARASGFDKEVPNYLSPTYGEAGRIFFRGVAKSFPADLWMRLISACSNSFSTLYCFDVEQIVNKTEFRRPVRCLMFSNRLVYWDKFVAYWGPWALVGLILFFGARNVIVGALLGGFLVLLLGYTSILFEFRHIVHLVPICYSISIVVLWWIIKGVTNLLFRIRKFWGEEFRKEVYILVKRGIGTVIILVVGTFVIYLALLLWQNWMTKRLLSTLSKAEWESVEVAEKIELEKVLYQPTSPLFDLENIKNISPLEVLYKYLRVDLEIDGCEGIEIGSRYSSEYSSVDFSERFDELIKESFKCLGGKEKKVVKIYFPVFCTATLKPTGEPIFENKMPLEWVRNKWLGVEKEKDDRCRVVGVYALKQGSNVPLMFTLAVQENGGGIKPKRWRWGWNPQDVEYNLNKNTAVFAQYVLGFTGRVCGKE